MLIVYSLDLFKRAKVPHNHYVLAIVTLCCLTAGYLISTYLTKRVPRKVHFIISGLALANFWFIGGMILKLAESSDNPIALGLSNYVFPVCVVLAGLSFGLGVGSVPFALLGEVLPQKIKAPASALILTLRYMAIFVFWKSYPAFISRFGAHSTLWFCCSVSLVISLLAYLIMPETRGKTLTELSNLFEKKSLKGNIKK